MAAYATHTNAAKHAARHHNALTALAACLLGLLALPACAAPLLDVNFDNINGLPTQGSVKSIASALSTPGDLPANTIATQTDPNQQSINVRRGDDIINTALRSWDARTGFGSFFAPSGAANKFLVLGDSRGAIGSSIGVGTFLVALPFVVPTLGPLTVSFDYAFNGLDTSSINADIFSARIVDQLDPLNFFDLLSPLTSPAFGRSQVERTLDISGNLASLAGHASYLEFKLVQGASGTTSAAGIDNIRVIPEPGSAMLLGIGLAALTGSAVATRRRRGKAA